MERFESGKIGKEMVNGKIAFVPQEAWLQNLTIRLAKMQLLQLINNDKLIQFFVKISCSAKKMEIKIITRKC